MFNLSLKELHSVGIKSNTALVDKRLIPKLKAANKIFNKHKFELIVKDGYRSPEQYKLVQQKRYQLDSKVNTDKTLNLDLMIHSTGLCVDINLIDLKNNREVKMWDKKDWPDGVFVNFYRHGKDTESQKFQQLQDLLVNTMLSLEFTLGTKNEFWHFEYLSLKPSKK